MGLPSGFMIRTSKYICQLNLVALNFPTTTAKHCTLDPLAMEFVFFGWFCDVIHPFWNGIEHHHFCGYALELVFRSSHIRKDDANMR